MQTGVKDVDRDAMQQGKVDGILNPKDEEQCSAARSPASKQVRL